MNKAVIYTIALTWFLAAGCATKEPPPVRPVNLQSNRAAVIEYDENDVYCEDIAAIVAEADAHIAEALKSGKYKKQPLFLISMTRSWATIFTTNGPDTALARLHGNSGSI